MQTNWMVIAIVVILGIVLVIYLIRQNRKDEKEVEQFFDRESSDLKDDEPEFNDEK